MKRLLLNPTVWALAIVAGVMLFDPNHAHALAAVPLFALTNMNSAQVQVIDPVLTTVAQGYKQQNLVGERILPEVPVETTGGQILQFGKEAFMRYNLRRAPGGSTKRIDFGYLGLPFALLQDAVEVKVPREWQRDASIVPGVDLATRAINLGMGVAKLSLEWDIAQTVLNPANVLNSIALSGTAKWSNAASTPIAAIMAAKETVRQSIGQYPNLATFSPVAWNAFKTNPNVVTRFQYTSHDAITEEMIANLLELEEVQVGKAVTSDDLGNFSDIWGNNMLLSYSPKNPVGPEQPSFGYNYKMRGHPFVEQPYWDGNARSWIYPTTYERVPVIAASGAAYLFQTPN